MVCIDCINKNHQVCKDREAEFDYRGCNCQHRVAKSDDGRPLGDAEVVDSSGDSSNTEPDAANSAPFIG